MKPLAMTQEEGLHYQRATLVRVSRTFALTIPQLPDGLRDTVANAYLLCRLADTIEDDPGLDSAAKAEFMAVLVAVMRGDADPDSFAERLGTRLSNAMSSAEHDLVRHTSTVLGVTGRLPASARHAVARCVAIMARGMPEFQRHASLDGLTTLQDLHRYCYCVAGVVGEMLTDLFCAHCPALAEKRDVMMKLAVRFGQGLQLTNILKDIWEDREANNCWLPRCAFAQVAGGLGSAMRRRDAPALNGGIRVLVGIAHGHLRAALDYTALIPKREVGIRRFCLWAIGMALLTLRNIHRRPGYRSAAQVKITRRAVRGTMLLCDAAAVSNGMLRLLFSAAAFGLPLARDGEMESTPGAWLVPDNLP
jgi:farnesyl-diphosphate farnesyltransferase